MKTNKNHILAERLQQAFIKNAGNIAISEGDNDHTYRELNILAGRISMLIMQHASKDRKAVAILGAKSFISYSGICGALMASRAYMPLNLKYPLSRNLKMLQLSGAKIIVADEQSDEMLKSLLSESHDPYLVFLKGDINKWGKAFPGHKFLSLDRVVDGEPPEITATPDDIAYLLFTSGTTGVPKGVPVSNLNVCSYLDHVLSVWDFSEKDRFSHTFDLTFDLSVHDMMVCWLSGACLCVPQDDSPLRMASYIRESRITVWFSVPSVAILMNKMRLLKKDTFETIRYSFFCGEPLPAGIAVKWQDANRGTPVINLYGPSEATIAISAYTWDEAHNLEINGIVSLGHIFDQQSYCVLDEDEVKKFNGRGELCLGGSQVIKGYLNDPSLSEKYFLQFADEPGKIWYRTGDLVEVDEDGRLYYLGRLDSEVKISGYRVNLYEIDAVIRAYTGAEQLASVLDDMAGPRIVTFIAEKPDKDESSIIAHCRKLLPWYMIPEVIIFVDEMPLNANGKIDRNMLKAKLNG